MGSGVSTAKQGQEIVSGITQAALNRAQFRQVEATTRKIESETMEHQVNSALLAAEVKKRQLEGLSLDALIPGYRFDSMSKAEAFWASAQPESQRSDTGFAADVRRRKAEAILAELGIAEAKSQSDFWKSGAGEMNPYLRQILEALRIIFGSGFSGRR